MNYRNGIETTLLLFKVNHKRRPPLGARVCFVLLTLPSLCPTQGNNANFGVPIGSAKIFGCYLVGISVMQKAHIEGHAQREPQRKGVHVVMEYRLLCLYSTATQNTWRRGVGFGQCRRRQNLALGIPTCWYLEPTETLYFAFFYLTRNPNASQWNIGCVRSQRKILALAMYISCIFHVVCASFSALASRELADAKADSSGIQAY